VAAGTIGDLIDFAVLVKQKLVAELEPPFRGVLGAKGNYYTFHETIRDRYSANATYIISQQA